MTPGRYLRTLHLLAYCVVLASAGGCGDKPPERAAKPLAGPPADPPPTPRTVAIMGDDTRLALLSKLAAVAGAQIGNMGPRKEFIVNRPDAVYRFQSVAVNEITTQAKLVSEAGLVLLAVDASTGPTPTIREQVIIARQMDAQVPAIVFTNCRLVDDLELLELEELEMRELLEDYGFLGTSSRCMFDELPADAPFPVKGAEQILNSSLPLVTERPSNALDPLVGAFQAEVRVLSRQEVFHPDTAATLTSGSLKAVIHGQVFTARLRTPRDIMPGATGRVEINADRPIKVSPTRPLLLLRGDHVTAIGRLLRDKAAD